MTNSRILKHAVTMTCLAALAISVQVAAQDPRMNPPVIRTVAGARFFHYRNGLAPANLSTKTIAAYVPDGSGGYIVLPGTGTSSGTFTIPNVPTGFYLLQFNNKFLWTNNTTVDADVPLDFRYNTLAADSSTTMTFDLANLNSWQSTDVFEMVCPNNLSLEFFPGTVGATTFTGTFGYVGNLSNYGSAGDQYYFAQLATQNVAGFPFTGLARFIAPAKFTQAQSSNTAINGSLQTIAQTGHFEANINGADMLAQALAANPNATLSSSNLYLDVYPGSFAHGQETDTPDLVIYNGVPTINSNSDLGSVSYGNPYPSTNPLYAVYYYVAGTNYTAPGATSSAQILTSAYGSTTNLPTSTSPEAAGGCGGEPLHQWVELLRRPDRSRLIPSAELVATNFGNRHLLQSLCLSVGEQRWQHDRNDRCHRAHSKHFPDNAPRPADSGAAVRVPNRRGLHTQH